MVQDSPPAGTAALHLAAGVEADDHAPSAEVIKAPGQVGVKSLKAAHSQLTVGALRKGTGRRWAGRTCVAWMTVRSLMRLNPAPMGALSPAVPKVMRLRSRALSSSCRPAATRDATWAWVQRFCTPAQDTLTCHTHTITARAATNKYYCFRIIYQLFSRLLN